jgi:hypothetical protein
MAAHMALLESYAPYRARQAELEQLTVARRETAAAVPKRVTVDVVVNVVYQTDAQNVSSAQIKSQIDVLNRDYAAANPDKSKVPEVWKGLVTDSRLRFRLARTTRTRTTKASFTTDDSVKRRASGGIAPYRPSSHLNLWVCSLSGGVLGYAQFPGGPEATDGVVIDFPRVRHAGQRTGALQPRPHRPRTRSATTSTCGTSGATPRTARAATSWPTRRTPRDPTSGRLPSRPSPAATGRTGTCS